MYNLTESQKELLKWLVARVREKELDETFMVYWKGEGAAHLIGTVGNWIKEHPKFSIGAMDALSESKLIHCVHNEHQSLYESPSFSGLKFIESSRCTLLGNAYVAVDSDFAAPDTSFLMHLTPLADVTNLDDELKRRCLPILGAGGSDPLLWDSVVRTAGVILEERLRKIGEIADLNKVGRDLVNDVFSGKGTLAAKFANDSERLGYRDMYAGIVGVFRNPYAHRLIDPTPEDGGAFVIFVNLLLKLLEDLK